MLLATAKSRREFLHSTLAFQKACARRLHREPTKFSCAGALHSVSAFITLALGGKRKHCFRRTKLHRRQLVED